MANPEQLEIFKQGVEAWNQWRRENPDVKVDLRNAIFTKADLLGVNLRDAILFEVDLRMADLRVANLCGAKLINAILNEAKLTRANLEEAVLNGTNLNNVELNSTNLFGASLIDAKLKDANLRDAKLIKANLSEAELNNAVLWTANLSEANLTGANLINASLIDANFSDANLTGANLSNASLQSTKFVGTELREANLSKANLEFADFNDANLTDANLSLANFMNAIFGYTLLGRNDLSETVGLETIEHFGPSVIGVDTIQRSNGKIPVQFLMGCGLSDLDIEYAKLHNFDLSNEEINEILYRVYDIRAKRAIQISPLFISYSHADSVFVDKIEEPLNVKGIRFWRDVHHATAGRLEKQIDRAIRHNPTVLVILSRNSIKSDWVEHEVRAARELEKETGRDVLCPVALDDSWKDSPWPKWVMEQVMEYNILDFSKWDDDTEFEKLFRKLIDGLELFYK